MGIYITGPFFGGVVALSATNAIMMPLFGQDWRSVLMVWAGLAVLSGALWWLISANSQMRAMEAEAKAAPRVSTRGDILVLLSLRPVQLLLVAGVSIFMINHGFNNWLPEILRAGQLDAAWAGSYAALRTVMAICGSLVLPRLATPGRRLTILGLLAVCAASGTLLLILEPGPLLIPGLLLQGIARGAMMTIAMLILIDLPAVGEKRVGTASGLYFSFAEVGGVAGPLTLGLLYDLTGGFTVGLFTLAGFAGVILLSVLALVPYVGRAASERRSCSPCSGAR